MTQNRCTFCEGELIDAPKLLNFGFLPITSVYENDTVQELSYVVCSDCGVAQSLYPENENVLYGEGYNFFSGQSNQFEVYSKKLSQYIEAVIGPIFDKSLLEIGCNDGVFLSKVNTAKKIGIEPSISAFKIAKNAGLNVINEFFSQKCVEINNLSNSFDLVVSLNVISHVTNISDYLESIHDCLKVGGYLTIEMVNYDSILKHSKFEYFYHGVQNLFLPSQLVSFFKANYQLVSESVGHDPFSIVLILKKVRNTKPNNPLVNFDFNEISYQDRLDEWVGNINDFFINFSEKKVAGYAANSKAGMVLLLCQEAEKHVQLIFDINPSKQGHFLTKKTKQTIAAPQLDALNKFDIIILFADHLYDEVNKFLRESGFIGYLLRLPNVA